MPSPAGGQTPDPGSCSLLRWLRKDGQTIWLERRGVTVRDEQSGAALIEAVICDVSDRVRAQEAVREGQLWQSALLRALPVVVARFTQGSGPALVWISDSVEAATGFPAARFLGDPAFWLERVHPTDRSGALALLEGKSSAPQAVRFGWRRADEQYRWFAARVLHVPSDEAPAGEQVIALSPIDPFGAMATRTGDALDDIGGARTTSHWRRIIVAPPAVARMVDARPACCPRCGSASVARHSRQVRRLDGGRTQAEVVRYRCHDCDATFTAYPRGVSRTMQGDAVKALGRVLYGLGLSKHQVSTLMGQAGVVVSEGTVWRNARQLGGAMREAAPPGARCLLPGEPTPSAGDFVVVDRLEVAGPDTEGTVLELMLWEHSGGMLPWLRSHLEAMGRSCEVVIL